MSKDKDDGEIERDLFPVIENSGNGGGGGSRDSSYGRSPRSNSLHRSIERNFDRDLDRGGGFESNRSSFRSLDNTRKEKEFSFEKSIRNRSEKDVMSRDRDNFRFNSSRYD